LEPTTPEESRKVPKTNRTKKKEARSLEWGGIKRREEEGEK
jgi:hypothetical protein